MSADATIREILEKYDERPGDGVTWKVQSATVITHKALERIAAKAKISFDPPTIIRSERDEAVILVSGSIALPPTLGATVPKEWSIGEALVNVNYRVSGKQAAYVYAMAEKRAKDRVILKLIGLHGLLYSEEEADEFKARGSLAGPSDEHDGDGPALAYIGESERRIERSTDRTTLLTWWNSEDRKARCRDFDLSEDEVRALYQKVKAKAEVLQARAAA
jgi:hypothetical protein